MTRTTRRQRAIVYLGLTVGLALVAGPFLWTALSSFKPEREIRRDPPTFWPETWTLDNFAELFGRVDLGTAFANSLIIALVLVATNLLFCSMVGYAFAKLSFRGKNLAFGLVLVQLAIPAIVVMMPQFVLIARFGMVNTFLGIILPTVVTPLGVFMMRQFISDLPDELIDAARVDGAREFRVFFTIILPLCGPALATLASSRSSARGTTSSGPPWSPRARTCTPCPSPSTSSTATRAPTTTCWWPDRSW